MPLVTVTYNTCEECWVMDNVIYNLHDGEAYSNHCITEIINDKILPLQLTQIHNLSLHTVTIPLVSELFCTQLIS